MTTKIEVASLLSKMGFEIDTAQLEKFEKLTRGIRTSTVKLARDLRQTNNQLNSVSQKLRSVNNGLNSTNSKRGAANLAHSYASLSKNVNVAQTALNRFNTTATAVEPKLMHQLQLVGRLANSWGEYARSVRQANRDLRDRPVNPNGRPPRVGGGGGTGSGGGQPRRSGRAGLLGETVGGFAAAFTPASAIAGGAITAGFVAKQVYDAGKEYRAMRQVLLASSKDVQDFNRNLEFTRKTSNALGVDVVEFGKAYSKTLQAVGDQLSRTDTEKMYRQFSELMVVMHSSADDQKGIFRAMSQMFSKGKIQMEEINQMAERNVPALAMMKRAYQELGYTQAEFEKMQKAGKINPNEFLPLMAKYAEEYARNNGALEKALESSTTKLGILKNQFKETSDAIMEGGLDKLIADLVVGITSLTKAFAPLAIRLSKVALGFAEVVGWIAAFAKEHPVLAAIIASIIAGFFGIRGAMKAGMTMGGAFVATMIAGMKALKMAMMRTAILAIFIGIAEVLVALYEHMNGEKNWMSVMINWLELLGLKIKGVWLDFQILIAAITRSFKDSWLGQFLSKLFNFDFAKAFSGAKDKYMQDQAEKQGQTYTPRTEQKPNPFGLTQNQVDDITKYAKTVPAQQGSAFMGNLDVSYRMEIVNGKQTFVSNNKQTVSTGGLRTQ